MTLPSNTITDLLQTASSDKAQGIYCPKCGSQLSFQLPYSVAPIFNSEALDRVNQWLVSYRQIWIEPLVRLLNEINIGVKPRDPITDSLFSKDLASKQIRRMAPNLQLTNDDPVITRFRGDGIHREGDVAKELQELRLALEQRFDDLANHLKSSVRPVDELKSDDEDWQATFSIIDSVLLQMEPADFFATLTDIVTSQQGVQEWVQETKSQVLNMGRGKDPNGEQSPSFSESLVGVLRKLCPPMYTYLWDYLSLIGKAFEDEAKWEKFVHDNAVMLKDKHWVITCGSNEETIDVPATLTQLKNRFERGCFLVALFSMHDTAAGVKLLDKYFKSAFGTRNSRGYLLPEMAVVTYRQMIDFMLSAEVVQFNMLGLQHKYTTLLQGIQPQEKSKDSALRVFSDGLNDKHFREVVGMVYGFACTGRASKILEFLDGSEDKGPVQTGDVSKYDFCGWYPKKYSTYGIVLLGAPGSGKSMAFLSGATILDHSLLGLNGFSVYPDDPKTFFQVSRLEEMFKAGRKPQPTSRTDHHALSFRLAPKLSDGDQDIGFVFVDIPGELATLQQREGVKDPVVSNTLAHADIVMVFLDLNTDSKFGPRFLNGPNKSHFKAFKRSRELAQTQRTAANLDQFQFVKNIADSCIRLRNGDNLPHFLVVIPKCDLYMNKDANVVLHREGTQPTSETTACFFLHALFEKLAQEEVLYFPEPAPSGGAQFAGLTSRGGTTRVPIDNKTQRENAASIDGQKSRVREVSETVKKLAGTLGGVVLADPKKTNPEARKWNQAIPALANELEGAFTKDKVLFIPISAQGNQPDDEGGQTENDGSQTEEPDGHSAGGEFPQKLCEFVFLAPMMIAATARETKPNALPLEEQANSEEVPRRGETALKVTPPSDEKVDIKCPHCSRGLKASRSAIGKASTCPQCSQKFTIDPESA